MGIQEASLSRWLLGICTCVLVAYCRTGGADPDSSMAPTEARVIGDEFFGMHVRYAVSRTPWPRIRFHGWRVITPETEWRGLQPSRRQWNFSSLDRAVALAERHGVEVLLTLGQTPSWAAARPHELVPNGPGASSEPADMKDWEVYIRTVVSRYQGRIKYYELWNEPRFREVDPYVAAPGFTGSAYQMVEMARIAKRVLADVDPNAALVSPAIDAGFAGLSRMRAWLDAGGGDVSDVFAYHFYLRPPERMPELYRQLRVLLHKYGQTGKPLWNTESGYFVENPEQPTTPQWPGTDYVFGKVLSPYELGAYVIRAHALTAAVGLDRFYWYSWDIRNMGLTRGFGTVPTVAAEAYRKTVAWLRRAEIYGCQNREGDVWVCTLARPEAGKAWLVWNASGAVTWRVPDEWGVAEVESVSEGESPVSNGRIQIGPMPMLLKERSGIWGVEGD